MAPTISDQHQCSLKADLLFWRIVVAWFMLDPLTAGAQTVNNPDAKLLLQLQEIITLQQEQLQKQSARIQAQSETLTALQRQLDDLKHETTGAHTQAAQALSVAQQAAIASRKSSPQATVSSTQEHTKLAISGQVNRVVNVVNDGNGTGAYFVDSDASNSRVRFVGTAMVNDDTTLGTRFEVAMAPDESSQISQKAQSSGDFFDQRWAEVSLNNKQYGKLSLGKGDTASNNTAEVDLSHTDVVQNSSVDIASGMLFRESAAPHALTTIRLDDAFQNRDGLSRQSRLRYDTPNFAGFNLAGSLVSNQRADMAIFWGGQGYGFKAVAAAAIANPRKDNSGLQHDGSFSILHGNSGLNLTLSAGLLDGDNRKDPTNLYVKLGWTTTLLFDFGYTAFGVDYTRSANLPAENDIGYSASAAVVQSFDKYGAELYFQYRRFILDRSSGPSVDDLNLGAIGTRIKF